MAEHGDVADVETAFNSGNDALNRIVCTQLVEEKSDVLRSRGDVEVRLRRGGDVCSVDESTVGELDDEGVVGMIDGDD